MDTDAQYTTFINQMVLYVIFIIFLKNSVVFTFSYENLHLVNRYLTYPFSRFVMNSGEEGFIQHNVSISQMDIIWNWDVWETFTKCIQQEKWAKHVYKSREYKRKMCTLRENRHILLCRKKRNLTTRPGIRPARELWYVSGGNAMKMKLTDCCILLTNLIFSLNLYCSRFTRGKWDRLNCKKKDKTWGFNGLHNKSLPVKEVAVSWPYTPVCDKASRLIQTTRQKDSITLNGHKTTTDFSK